MSNSSDSSARVRVLEQALRELIQAAADFEHYADGHSDCSVCRSIAAARRALGDAPGEPDFGGDCGCDYELVEDGAVQRKRWFHSPDCAGRLLGEPPAPPVPQEANPSQTRSLLFRDYRDWYRLRSLLLRLAAWQMGGTMPYLSAGDLQVAGEYAERLNDIDCTYTLKAVKEMGWHPPGESL